MEVLFPREPRRRGVDQSRRPRRVHRPVHRRAGIRGQHAADRPREAGPIEDNLEFVKKTMAGMTKAEIDMPSRRPRPRLLVNPSPSPT
ncbi:MAG: hypothetical protein ACLRM9_10405 [Collinsella aerofaciens]